MKTALAALLLAAAPAFAQNDSAADIIAQVRAAAQKQKSQDQRPPDGLVFDGAKYNFARYEYNRGGDVEVIHSAREYLFRSDAAAVGGPRHVASFIYEPCEKNPGVCLVLLEPIRDIIKARGAQTNPYVYAVASAVLSVAAEKFGTIAALNPAYDRYTANKPDAAVPAALEILRAMLASSQSVKADDPTDYHHSRIYERDTTVAAMAAEISRQFADAAPFLEKNLKESLEGSKDQAQTVALAAALTARARNADTLRRLAAALAAKDPAPVMETRVALLKDLATTARTVWPHGIDPAGHPVWDAAAIESARPYFDIACAATNDEKDGCAPKTATALCNAGTELLFSAPKKHRASCGVPDGRVEEN